jgi:hypothetical protein
MGKGKTIGNIRHIPRYHRPWQACTFSDFRQDRKTPDFP